MLNIDKVSKAFGGQVLLDETGFQINTGERVGLVGRNGHGKTTLLNMISGLDHPDDGAISIPGGYSLGCLSQKISFSKNTVIDEAMLGLRKDEKDHYWKAEKILAGLGFSPEDFSRPPEDFSGGYQVRLNLAKVLVSEPDLLILDEPTNYLDIVSIRWITGFLLSWPREVLLVTHDRSFMDRVVTHIAGIHRGKIKKIKGDTSKYYAQIAQDEEVYEKTRLNEEKKKKEMEQFITRFRAKARLANMVQSRIKTLEKIQNREKLQELKQLSFSFNYLPFGGKQLTTIEDLHFGYTPEIQLIQDFSLTIYPGDRVGIVGKNGQGKTTLLKLISGKIKPMAGEIRFNPGVTFDYFEQTNVLSLNETFTVEEELMYSCPDADRQKARNICGAMMFGQDAALKKIGVLSGGEKARVMLGKLLMTPLNFLLLDEPTNHLDIEACDAFVDALNYFDGAIALVTHNEMFLHALANRLVVFKNGGIQVFEGSYSEFLEKEGWEDQESGEEKKIVVKPVSVNKKDLRRKKSSIISEKSGLIKPVKKKIESLEKQIEKNELAQAAVNEKLVEASTGGDGDRIKALSIELSGLEKDNSRLFDDLEEQMERFDEIEAQFDRALKEIEED